MSTETRHAFDHPEARARATAGPDPCDRISVRDHIVTAEIGAFQQERGHRQRLRFNIVVELRPQDGPVNDDVDRILSYDTITEAIAAELSAERLNLLETLAERVADRVLAAPQATRAFVRIEKLDRGPGALGVEIVRSRAAAPSRSPPSDDSSAALHPLVAFLDNDAIADPGLPDLLDRLEGRGLPLVLCVGLPDGGVRRSAAPAAQRRIDLLAIEQNAWVLSGRDRRCIVVASRTEIDWAMKQGQTVVWAPTKLVLDAASDGPAASDGDAVALALWLAETLAADRLLITGMQQPPAGSRVSVERLTR